MFAYTSLSTTVSDIKLKMFSRLISLPAIQHYDEWGASAKVDQLEMEYAYLLTPPGEIQIKRFSSDTTESFSHYFA